MRRFQSERSDSFQGDGVQLNYLNEKALIMSPNNPSVNCDNTQGTDAQAESISTKPLESERRNIPALVAEFDCRCNESVHDPRVLCEALDGCDVTR